MKRILLFCLLAGIYVQGYSQASSCAQTLRLARSTYEQGRLHELEGILNPCINSGFTAEEKVEAYKLLTLAYIYLEEPQKADEQMRKILETDHYFQINPEIDPAEFVALYKTFRTDPVYSLGLKFGPSLVVPSVINDYYTSSDAVGSGKYSPGLGIQVGVFFEKSVYKKFSITPEVLFASRRYSETTSLFVDDVTQELAGSNETIYKQSWIDLNALVKYEITTNAAKTFGTYAGLGPMASFSMSQKAQVNTIGLSGSAVSGADVDVKDSFKTVFYAITVFGGIKYRIGGLYVIAELRYQYGLNNIVNPENRTNTEVALDYGAQFNDHRLSTLTGALGVSIPFFKPEKIKVK